MFPSWQHVAMSKLRTFRESRGLSQEDLAKSVGVEKATISRIENGHRVPSMGLVSRLCEVSGGELTANDFMPTDVAASEPERTS
jgi:transcriptional regulator with XRE-family HTH domain